jgi:hypothetical protein
MQHGLLLSDCPTFWGISAQAVLELIPSITVRPMVEALCPGKSAADLQTELGTAADEGNIMLYALIEEDARVRTVRQQQAVLGAHGGQQHGQHSSVARECAREVQLGSQRQQLGGDILKEAPLSRTASQCRR